MITYAKIYAAELALLCSSSEGAIDAISVMYNAGREKQPGETNTVTFDPLNGLSVASWNNAATQAIGGLTLDVRRGRQAADLAEAATSTSAFLVLTTSDCWWSTG